MRVENLLQELWEGENRESLEIQTFSCKMNKVWRSNRNHDCFFNDDYSC